MTDDAESDIKLTALRIMACSVASSAAEGKKDAMRILTDFATAAAKRERERCAATVRRKATNPLTPAGVMPYLEDAAVAIERLPDEEPPR